MNIFTKKSAGSVGESCDVLLTYETRNREIENLCLLKVELEKRGYSVKIRMQYDTFFRHHRPINARLVVVPAYYRPRAQFYASSHTTRTDKILNMMWEQVRSTRDEKKSDTILSVKEWGRVASHVVWGSFTRDRLINEWGCTPSHVFMTGHITLDFLRQPLVNYYESRETLFSSFGIPADKKVHLFISSLSYADVDMRIVKNSSMGDTEEEVLQYKQLCADTRKELLVWFEKILNEDENNIIIYRPHPEEKGDSALFELTRRQNRFMVINDRSVKQWIIACDRIYTWKSTAIAEVKALGKGFTVLRPYPIPIENDIGILSDMAHVTTYEKFREVFFAGEQKLAPSLTENIEKYYYISEDRFTYELICDAIEQILSHDEYNIVPPLPNQLLKWYYPERIKNILKRFIAGSKLCEGIQKSGRLKGTIIGEWLDDIYYVKRKLKKNYTTDEEIAEITERIKKAMSQARDSIN